MFKVFNFSVHIFHQCISSIKAFSFSFILNLYTFKYSLIEFLKKVNRWTKQADEKTRNISKTEAVNRGSQKAVSLKTGTIQKEPSLLLSLHFLR